MARQINERELYDLLLTKYDKQIAQGFLASIDDLRSQADVDQLVDAIKRRNLEDALAALYLQEEAFEPLADQIRFGFVEAGTSATEYMPPLQSEGGEVVAVVRFSARNPRAEEWLSTRSSDLITAIVDDQRTAIQQALTGGMEAGQNPRDTALDIVGRYNTQTRQREGGIVGLTAQQESYVANARRELLSGDATQLGNYLTRSMRDHRFDKQVEASIRNETPLDADTVAKMTQRYSDRLLKLRGDTIGRTESLTALRAGKYEAYQQAIETGSLQDTAVKKIWRTAGDDRVRDSHAEMDGESVDINEPFKSPNGAEMLFPGDVSLGAGPEEIINCRCDVEYKADFLGAQAAREEAEPPLAEGEEPPAPEPIPPEEFQAEAYYTENDEAGITPDVVERRVADYEGLPDLPGRIGEIRNLIAETPDAVNWSKNLNSNPDGTYTSAALDEHLGILYTGQMVNRFDWLTGQTVTEYVPGILSPEAIARATPAEGEDPKFVMLGGRGGSGKSKLEGIAYDPKTMLVLDNDAIKARLTGYEGWNAALFHEEASDIFDEAVRVARDNGLNVVVDQTMKSTGKAIDMVNAFKDAGYETEAAYMYLPRQDAAERAITRFLTREQDYSGRFVPPDVVLQNTTNEKTFDAIKGLVDSWMFYDNRVPGPKDPPILVSRSE